RYGERRVVIGGAGVAGTGLAVARLLGRPDAATAGFVLVGIGIACTFPITLQIATRTSARPGHAIAAVCTLGYTGFLIGPPVIGLLGEATSLTGALVLLPALALLIAALSRKLRV
ncbi:MAG: MFS transporter, partial [Geminicoccaceae bacterium]|nr:MFS transporter [Geminicoccaceae bacterium]